MKKLLAALISQVNRFVPVYDHGDRNWEFYLRAGRRWHYLNVKEYKRIYYFSGDGFEGFSTEQPFDIERLTDQQRDYLRSLPGLLSEVFRLVRKDPVAYHRMLLERVSPGLRTGIVPRPIVQRLLPDYMRFDRELKKTEIQAMVELLRKPMHGTSEKMTAKIYFDYCRTAYLANGRKTHKTLDRSMSGRELYRRWADNRDGGLKQVPLRSERAFERWYESDSWHGGHPWEIYRGGNSTHIDLAVIRNSVTNKWEILLEGFSSTRLVEVCRIALALKRRGHPFKLGNQDSYLARLTRNDWIGIVPEDAEIKYAYHGFPENWHVADCIHYSWFRGHPDIRSIRRSIVWFPLPFVRIRGL